jgi:hypothetical protein
MLTWRLLQASRVAMPSTVAVPVSISDSHCRPRVIPRPLPNRGAKGYLLPGTPLATSAQLSRLLRLSKEQQGHTPRQPLRVMSVGEGARPSPWLRVVANGGSLQGCGKISDFPSYSFFRGGLVRGKCADGGFFRLALLTQGQIAVD